MNYLEEMILECDNIEDLERLKGYVKMTSKSEKKCNHPVIYYLDYDINYQETIEKYLCLKCKKEIDGSKGLVIKPKSSMNLDTRNKVALSFSNLYFDHKDDEDICTILSEFQEYIDRERIADSFSSNSADYINSLITVAFKSFMTIRQVKKKGVI